YSTAAGGKDRLYLIWHQDANLNAWVACSSDSGATWTPPQFAIGGPAAVSKSHVRPDGALYVLSRSAAVVVIDKFSKCDSGFARAAAFPSRFSIQDVACPVAGLDRCNNGNTLSSPTIAAHDTDRQKVVVAWAENWSDGKGGTGEDVLAK